MMARCLNGWKRTGVTAELIADGAVPRNPVISPDGRWVAFAVAGFGVTEPASSALWVAAADATASPRKLADVSAREFVPRWAPDSSSVFLVSGLQVHRIRLGGGEAEVLTAWRSGIGDLWPLAGGEMVAVAAADGPTERDQRRLAERDDAIVWAQRMPCARLRLLDLSTGSLRAVDGLAGRHVVEVIQRPDGGPLAVLSWATPEKDVGAADAELHLVDPQTGAAVDLGQIEIEPRSLAWWYAGGWHLAYLAVTPPGSVGSLAVFDVEVPAAGAVAGASAAHRSLAAGMAACPPQLVQVANGPPLALFADGLDTAIWRLDPDATRFRRLWSGEGDADGLSASPSGEMRAMRLECQMLA